MGLWSAADAVARPVSIRSGIAALIGGGGEMAATGVDGTSPTSDAWGATTAVRAAAAIADTACRSTRIATAMTVGTDAQQSVHPGVRWGAASRTAVVGPGAGVACA